MHTITPITNTQHIYDLVGLCADYGVKKAVVCPGSRCAPLLFGFSQHPEIETISVTDERSAGFIGLGLAQQSGKPVALVCTSGTAAQNFAPAVTEAFYQNVPLIVLTADRPPEWIDQWDGQTIHQENMFEPHIKGSFNYDENNVIVGEEALTLALDEPTGPAHINIPIREPFYPESLGEIRIATKGTKITKEKKREWDGLGWQEFESILDSSDKVMLLGGQMAPNPELVTLLNQLDVPIVGDVISNLHGVDGVIKSADLLFKTFLPRERTKDAKKYQPDLMVTFGRSVVSKNLKLFLRRYKPKRHWHIGLGMVGNPFQSLTKIVECDPIVFFKKWVESTTETVRDGENYKSILAKAQINVDNGFSNILHKSKFNYFSAVEKMIKHLPEKSVLHLGNSMPVRIANFIGINDPTIDIWCNRGTSGIDGVVSTAVGHSLAEPKRKHTLIVGDISFFYDRNGLWLNHEFPTNLQIVILNDGGGGIFNIIPGPSKHKEMLDLFTTPHRRTAELTAKEFGLDYQSAKSLNEITRWKPGILEIFTDMKINMKVFKLITSKGT